MTPQRLQQIEEVYHSARDRAPGQRGAFLAEACRGDPQLHREVESLLAQNDREGVMERPAMELAANLLANSVAPQTAVGTQLGPYQIESRLGAGGMGEVYGARDTRLNRVVAIKILKEQFSERFQREARAIAALNHPNICTIHDVGPNYLVMELVEGQTLAERIRERAIPLEEALAIARQIADALSAAHDKGIVHRDLKPGNIKVKPDGTVKVLDFGLAKVTPVSTADSAENSPTFTAEATQAGMILGTAAYMAPEQARGKSVDKRADIWAFGVVLYEMLAGDRLFKGDDFSEIFASVMKDEPDWRRVPAQVQRLLRSCLEKDPSKRLRDIGDAWRLLDDGQTPAPSTSRFGTAGWITAVALGLALIAMGVIYWLSPRSVDRPLIRLDASLGPDAIAGASSSVAISPDGTRIVFPIRGTDGKQLLATRLLDQAAITPLPGTENGLDAFFSPDGQWIGFWADNKLKKVSFRGGAPVTLSDASAFEGASWGENGDIVTSLSVAGGLLSIPASGGAPHTVTNSGNDEFNHLSPQVLPGGTTVLFTAQKTSGVFDDANIEAVSLKNGSVKTLVSRGYFGRYLATNGSTGHLVFLRQGELYAVPFDPVRLEVRGMPEPILEDVDGFDFSRNGTLVYSPGIATQRKWPMVLLDSSGKTEPLLTTPGNYTAPAFSEDGKRLALELDNGGIFVYDFQRDAMSRLPTVVGISSSPVWSRDGEHLAFESDSASGSRLNWMRADGSGETQVLLVESKNICTPSAFSPDGRRLAYSELKPDGDIDLWTLPLDTSDPEHPKPGKPEPFLETPAVEAVTVFSPDGHYVAYFSNESGGWEVYVRPAPGPDGKPGPGKWQISTGGISSFPVWSPNGRELFYRAGNRIMVTDYRATAGSFSSGKPRLWSDRQIHQFGLNLPFALAPDGKHFAVTPAPEAAAEDKGPAHVTFLLNFFDELRRKVPAGR